VKRDHEEKSRKSRALDRRGLGWRESAQWLEQPVVPARPCSRRGGFSLCCNSPRTTEGHGGGAVRQTQDMIKAFPPHRANQPFRIPILPWRARRNWPVTNAHSPKPPGENLAIDPVAIAHDVAWRPFPTAGFGELPGQPFSAGVCRHSEPQELAPAVPKN
jgi:hypothetical protein